MTRSRDAGFSVMEALVAVAILAIALIPILMLQTQTSRASIREAQARAAITDQQNALAMLRQALDSFARLDVSEAMRVVRQDNAVDDEFRAIMRQLITFMMEDPRTITACTHLLFMAKNIERAGDHVTNIAELVSFRSTGHGFDETRPKGSAALYATGTAS